MEEWVVATALGQTLMVVGTIATMSRLRLRRLLQPRHRFLPLLRDSLATLALPRLFPRCRRHPRRTTVIGCRGYPPMPTHGLRVVRAAIVMGIPSASVPLATTPLPLEAATAPGGTATMAGRRCSTRPQWSNLVVGTGARSLNGCPGRAPTRASPRKKRTRSPMFPGQK